MAICNIFNEFQESSGNFLTFSQYTEDLTKHTSQYGAYKISPSKFIVMDVQYNNVKNKLVGYGISSNLNIGIPKYFQDYFENSCAYMRLNGTNWDPIVFSNLFWNSLYLSNMISISGEGDDTYINEAKYIGDINIQSHNIFGGEGFILQKVSGHGIAFAEFDGHVIEYELQPGQQIVIDSGHLAAMTPSCSMDIRTVPGVKNALFGGEGIFNTVVTGPGRVWVQTMPISRVAGAIRPYIPTGN